MYKHAIEMFHLDENYEYRKGEFVRKLSILAEMLYEKN